MHTDSLSITFAALADPTRRAILARLAQGGTSVTELAKPFSINPSAVTKHLKGLRHAKLITQGCQAQCRPFQLNAAPLNEAANFIGQYRLNLEQSSNAPAAIFQNLK